MKILRDRRTKTTALLDIMHPTDIPIQKRIQRTIQPSKWTLRITTLRAVTGRLGHEAYKYRAETEKLISEGRYRDAMAGEYVTSEGSQIRSPVTNDV